MTIFLIWVTALLIVAAMVTWGVAMVMLRLAPLYIMYMRRKRSYHPLRQRVEENERMLNIWVGETATLKAKLQKLEEEQVNEVLASRRR